MLKIIRALRILRHARFMHAALTEIRAYDRKLSRDEEVPTGEDYNKVVAVALSALDQVEAAKVPWWRVDPEAENEPGV